ncbi:FISUMP domain-containing protein [Fibrobacter sp. UWB2]|uniref:FISUMP domain-containing protein n=1 Tax=Fibrobacter sp. UWB2 TaxID=1964358 RepID=UPI0011830523|nr:FISUMP domain-containing protein [Fibrobacter sp. UWB2]
MRNFKYSIIASILLSVALIACGGDSGTSPSEVIPDSVPGSPSSSSVKKSSSSSVIRSSSSVIQSGDSREGSSNSKQSSSSSSKVSSSSAKATSSSSSAKVASSSSVSASSSSKKVESSSSQKISSSSSLNNDVSSGIEYKPYAHDTCLAGNWNVHKNDYKTFTDTRNGRSYYYYTAVSSKTGKSVTVMAENLNIGEMVSGENDQNDDAKIERYCYNNDTTYCDRFGGLYQWAEMMQLPSRCNTESCTDLIQEKHRGICPEGWRLFTWDDYVIIRQYEDKYDEGISGLRSQCFNGTNTSGFSLIGAGYRTEKGAFESLANFAIWNYPQEYGGTSLTIVNSALVSKLGEESPAKNSAGSKLEGVSIRCVKLE